MIRSLKIFCDVLETGSFTQAASVNYITQSAVSHHLRTLEDKLGRKLIERGPKKLRATAAGKLVYRAAREIIARYSKLEDDLNGETKEPSGAVRLCATLPVGLHFLPSPINGCLKRYPKVKISLSYLDPAQICEGVREDRFDAGFLTFPPQTPHLLTTIIANDALVVICAARDPLARRGTIGIRRLQDRSFVGPVAGHPVRRVMDGLFRKHKIKVRYLSEFTDLESAKQAVEAGLALSVVPRFTISKEAESGTLKELRIDGVSIDCPIGLVTRKNGELPPAARAFIDCITPSR